MVIAPARRAGDPGSNPGPGENFFPKLLIYIYIYIYIYHNFLHREYKYILSSSFYSKLNFILCLDLRYQ